MVYGAEAVLPHDLKFGAPRVTGYEEEEAEEALQDDKDIANEARDTALAKSEEYQDKLRTYQSSRLRTRTCNCSILSINRLDMTGNSCNRSTAIKYMLPKHRHLQALGGLRIKSPRAP